MAKGNGMPTVIVIAMAILGFARPAAAQLSADAVRGGWIADINGQRHVYVLKVRDTGITGIYCWDCNNPENLSFVENGRLDGQAIVFEVNHDIGPGAPYRENVRGTLEDGKLVLNVQRKGSSKSTKIAFEREPRKPAPPAPRPAADQAVAPPPRPPYVPPGPNEPLTAETISGLWLTGAGPNKQYFMFRHVGSDFRGIVCGPCDNPYNIFPIDTGAIQGDTFTFNILHEDWGTGPLPFNNQAVAHVAKNEMHMLLQRDNVPPRPDLLGITLIGPIRLR